MRKTFILLILLVTVASGFTQNSVAVVNAKLRESNSTSSSVLATIPKGTLLEISDCRDGWCKTELNAVKGFVSQGLVRKMRTVSTQKTAVATGPVKHYINSQNEKVQSPTKYDKAPEGATARCSDGTYSFSRSRRGTCSHHGGVAEWL